MGIEDFLLKIRANFRFKSQFLLVGFPDKEGDICLITVDPKVPNGQKMF